MGKDNTSHVRAFVIDEMDEIAMYVKKGRGKVNCPFWAMVLSLNLFPQVPAAPIEARASPHGF